MTQPPAPVCWFSTARYPLPLEATAAAKWRLLAEGLPQPLHVIGFAAGLRPRRQQQLGVQFWLMPQPPTAPLRYLFAFALLPLLGAWIVARQGARTLIAQSPYEGAAAALLKGLLRLFGLRLRLIVENHNNFEEDVFLQRRVPLMGLYRALMLRAARFAFRHADAVRVISTSTAERAAHFAPHAPQVRFMTWTDASIFRDTARPQPLSQSRRIAYAGVLIPRKGVHHLLNAFARLSAADAQLDLLGAPENASYAAELRAQAQRLGIAARVHFQGNLAQRALAQRLAEARVMALPSLSEGLGRVIVEAMLVQTPVIGARVGGIPDLIQPGITGWLVAPGDEDALHAALEEAFALPDETLDAMGQQARAFALDFFSPEAYLAGYRQLISPAEAAHA